MRNYAASHSVKFFPDIVTMDKWEAYRAAVEMELPGSQIHLCDWYESKVIFQKINKIKL